ncbi:Nitrogen fixation protein of unknown function [Lachnospiraceae bacterium JC7]|nr:Nitrogen fixation protein of unknown function [Lachnospiraceae bacterium JC7]
MKNSDFGKGKAKINIDNMDFSHLDPELRAKAEKCESLEELVQLAKENGIELSDEQLDMITGGGCESLWCFDASGNSTFYCDGYHG